MVYHRLSVVNIAWLLLLVFVDMQMMEDLVRLV